MVVTTSGAIVDFSFQVITQYMENGSVNISNVDYDGYDYPSSSIYR